MALFAAVAQRLRQSEPLQSLFFILAVLVLALVFSWPGPGLPNDSWSVVAQVRSVLLMLFAVGFGASAAAAREGALETLLTLFIFTVLSLPIEAFAYAASYPDVPVWWFAAQPPLDVGAYFGVGLVLGQLVRWLPLLLPLLPPLVLAALFGLSTTLELPLLNPFAAVRPAWSHLVVSALLSLATVIWCVRSRIKHAD